MLTSSFLLITLVVCVAAAVRGMWSPCGLSMLTSLNPVSERARGHRFWVTAGWYVAGATLGGALLGAACALGAAAVAVLGASQGWTWGVALVGAAIAVASDSPIVRWQLPDHPRQVDERWLDVYRRWVYASGYGVQIGAGFATYIMSAAVYLTALLAVLTAAPANAFLVGVTFGVVRGLCVLCAAAARTPDALRTTVRRVERLGPVSLRAVAVVEALVAATAGWFVGGGLLAAAAAALLAPCALAPDRVPTSAPAAAVGGRSG